MINYTLADKIRFLREESHLTQGEAARLLSIQRQTYCNYENERRTPPIEFITCLADYYQVSLDSLIRDNPDEVRFALLRVSIEEKDLVEALRLLPDQKQDEVRQFIQFQLFLIASGGQTQKPIS